MLAVAAGLTPLALMGRWPTDDAVETRIWAPVVPFAVCAFSALANYVLPRPSLRYWPVLCAFLATWVLTSEEATLWRNRTIVGAMGAELRSHMPESGFCVAVFEDSWFQDMYWLRDCAITAIITRDWPVDEARRFWAFSDVERAQRHGLSPSDRGGSLRNRLFRREWQTFTREGEISRILWVRLPVTGHGVKEPVTGPLDVWPRDVTDDSVRAKQE